MKLHNRNCVNRSELLRIVKLVILSIYKICCQAHAGRGLDYIVCLLCFWYRVVIQLIFNFLFFCFKPRDVAFPFDIDQLNILLPIMFRVLKPFPSQGQYTIFNDSNMLANDDIYLHRVLYRGEHCRELVNSSATLIFRDAYLPRPAE